MITLIITEMFGASECLWLIKSEEQWESRSHKATKYLVGKKRHKKPEIIINMSKHVSMFTSMY